MKDFRNLQVWKKGHNLTLDLYKATEKFPKSELFGLVSEIRRCSASIPANIAEGCGRRGNGEFHRFLQIASGSGSELEYHLILSKDLGYLLQPEFKRLADQVVEVRTMLTGLIGRVEEERLRSRC